MSETDARPMNCRNRIRDNGLPYPRSGCAACGNGGLMGCPYERPAPTPPAGGEAVVTEAMIDAGCAAWVQLYPAFKGEKEPPTAGDVVKAILTAAMPTPSPRERELEEALAAARNDIGILLANIRQIEEATGEGPEGEDAQIVDQIEREHEARALSPEAGR